MYNILNLYERDVTLFSLGDDKRNSAVRQESRFLFLLFQKDTTTEEMQMIFNYS